MLVDQVDEGVPEEVGGRSSVTCQPLGDIGTVHTERASEAGGESFAAETVQDVAEADLVFSPAGA